MNVLHYAGRLYSLDTLDTRLTTSPKSLPSRNDPVKPSRVGPSSSPLQNGGTGVGDTAEGSSPSRWKTPEYIYHGLVFLVAVPLMFKTVIDLSKCEQPLICPVSTAAEALSINNDYSYPSGVPKVCSSSVSGLDPRQDGRQLG